MRTTPAPQSRLPPPHRLLHGPHQNLARFAWSTSPVHGWTRPAHASGGVPHTSPEHRLHRLRRIHQSPTSGGHSWHGSAPDSLRGSHDSGDGSGLSDVLAMAPDTWQERLRLPKPGAMPSFVPARLGASSSIAPARIATSSSNGLTSAAQGLFKTAVSQMSLDAAALPTLMRGGAGSNGNGNGVGGSSGEYSSGEAPFDSLGTMDEDPTHGLGSSDSSAVVYVKANFEVLRLEANGRVRPVYAKRRDLLREFRLQPRDLRRIDPTTDLNKNSRPSLSIKEDVWVLNLGGVRAMVTADKALFFEPNSPAVAKLLASVVPRLTGVKEKNAAVSSAPPGTASHLDYMARFYQPQRDALTESATPPFELEVLEGALILATTRLDAELYQVTRRVQALLTKLPADINPANLEELRRVKQALVEVENRADTLRDMLEELMDDEEELQDLNLTNRPRREERQRMRERTKLEGELDRARIAKEELVRRSRDGDMEASMDLEEELAGPAASGGSAAAAAAPYYLGGLNGSSAWPLGEGMTDSVADESFDTDMRVLDCAQGRRAGGGDDDGDGCVATWPLQPSLLNTYLQQLASTNGNGNGSSAAAAAAGSSSGVSAAGGKTGGRTAGMSLEERKKRIAALRSKFDREPRGRGSFERDSRGDDSRSDHERERSKMTDRVLRAVQKRSGDRNGPADWDSALEGSEEDIKEAQDALEEMVEVEEEARELEEVEDLLEYYVQRAAASQSEAERLLSGARDLEESIGVSLSARRYEVNRIELMLAIGSFSAAIGAVVAGIFGMNMRNQLESSVSGFWGVSIVIILVCACIFIGLMRYTQHKRIL